MKSIYLAFCSVIPWGLEPQSKEPESFILPLNYGTKCVAKIIKKKKGNHVPLYFLELINGVFSYYRN